MTDARSQMFWPLYRKDQRGHVQFLEYARVHKLVQRALVTQQDDNTNSEYKKWVYVRMHS